MGCSGPTRVKLEGLDMPLDSNFEKFNIEEIDSYFRTQKENIQAVENSREHYCDIRQELMILSGACVYKGNDFGNIYLGYLVNCELEIPGFVKRLKLQDEQPYFCHKEELQRNRKLNLLLVEYCNIVVSGKLQRGCLIDGTNNFENLLVERFEGGKLAIEKKKLQRNIELITKSNNIVNMLDEYIRVSDIDKLKLDVNIVDVVLGFVEKARNEGVTQPVDVMWINVGEKREGNSATFNRNLLEERLKEKLVIKENFRKRRK
jgi:hypothetical protein